MRLRRAEPGDLDTIIELIRALADYEREADAVTLDRERLASHLFGPTPRAEVLIAEADTGENAGFALFFHNFSTWKGEPGLYLEDLFVRPEYRGHGYGKALLAELARIAVERGCPRMDWSVLDWNAPSIAFYRALGAEPMEGWTTFRLAGDALRKLADSGGAAD
jgi:GNAT superfamily N-acetyltransferase